MNLPIVLVLAGGASRRFWPLRDKPLLEFAGVSLIARHLRVLRDLGVDRFVIVGRSESVLALREIVSDLALPQAHVVVQQEAQGMADAILSARREIASMGGGPIYITQAQDVVSPELHRHLLEDWRRQPAGTFALIAASRVKSYFPGGYLTVAAGRVTSIIEKPAAGQEPSDLVNIVAHCFGDWRPLMERLELLTSQGGDDIYERALTSLMAEREFHAFPYEGRWQAIKYPWHVLDVMELLLEHWNAGSESLPDEYNGRGDGVFLGRDVRIFPGAHVVAPAIIGPGSVIGHNALVRGCLVGANCVVGFGSEVARSYLAEGVQLHHNYVGDSILDRDTLLGYGATTANFRLDNRAVPSIVDGQRVDTGRSKFGLVLGAGAKVGVNTSVMPGVKIGAGAVVGPGLVLSRDVPDGARVLTQLGADRLTSKGDGRR